MEDDNPFAKYNYTRRKRQSDVWVRLAKIGGVAMLLGLLFLMYQSSAFYRKGTGASRGGSHGKTVDDRAENLVRENATLVMLVRYLSYTGQSDGRNRELTDALRSMRQIEDRFNRNYHYSWVFLNDEPFTQEFRLLTAGMASGEVEYGLIDKPEWETPPWIDTEAAQVAMAEMVEKDVIYGGSLSYRYPVDLCELT
jgi:Glycolipid 2-alpha-mannosyltransferase